MITMSRIINLNKSHHDRNILPAIVLGSVYIGETENQNEVLTCVFVTFQ